jgi:hypothetical protein
MHYAFSLAPYALRLKHILQKIIQGLKKDSPLILPGDCLTNLILFIILQFQNLNRAYFSIYCKF